MPDPPLDEFVDDPQLAGDIKLLRRLPPGSVVLDPNSPEGRRISGRAFQLQKQSVALTKGYPDRCMSFGLESIVVEGGQPPDTMLLGWAGYGLARVSAALLRSEGFGLQLVPEDEEPWHVAAFLLPGGSISSAKRSQGVLAEQAELVLLPHSDDPFAVS